MELGRLIYSRIKRHCAAGDKLADAGRFDEAIKKYNKAKDLLLDPVYDWEAATWIFTALGDAFYLSGRYEDAFHNLIEAQKCPDGIGNPFILLRIGQCYYELNDMGNARKYLLQAYMMEGDQIFQSEEEKYFKVIQGDV